MKMMKRTIFLLLIALGIGIISYSQTYKRIISLAPSLTQSLYYLNAEKQLVGCTSYCTFGVRDHKPVVANAINVNLEKVISLKPDLIITTAMTDKKTIASVQNFGIRVVVFSSAEDLRGICRQFIILGKLTGKENTAKKIVTESQQKANAIYRNALHKPVQKVFFQIGSEPLFTVPSGNFMNNYLSYLNCINIAANMKQGAVSREFVIAANPEHIFITTMDTKADAEKNVWLKYGTMMAAKKRQIHILDSDIACVPTPVTFVKTLELMNAALN